MYEKRWIAGSNAKEQCAKDCVGDARCKHFGYENYAWSSGCYCSLYDGEILPPFDDVEPDSGTDGQVMTMAAKSACQKHIIAILSSRFLKHGN